MTNRPLPATHMTHYAESYRVGRPAAEVNAVIEAEALIEAVALRGGGAKRRWR